MLELELIVERLDVRHAALIERERHHLELRRFRRPTRSEPNAYDLASRAFSSLRRTHPQPAPAPVLPQSFTRPVLRLVGLFALGFLAPPVATFLVLILFG